MNEENPLGRAVPYPEQYSPELLYAVPREGSRATLGLGGALPFTGTDIWNAWELTWLDPDGLPRCTTAEIRVPADSPNIVESKSLKLFLGSYRNHGAFHEACTTMIGQRLVKELSPKWLRIGGYWYPRGGIPIDVFYATGEVPAGVWIPDQGVPPYRGRG